VVSVAKSICMYISFSCLYALDLEFLHINASVIAVKYVKENLLGDCVFS